MVWANFKVSVNSMHFTKIAAAKAFISHNHNGQPAPVALLQSQCGEQIAT